MQTFSSYEDWLSNQPEDLLPIIEKLAATIANVAPSLLMSSKWGNAVWQKDQLPIIFIHTKPDHIQLGFFAGAALDDPTNLLVGKAKFVRHVPISDCEFDVEAISHLIRDAEAAEAYR